MALMENQKSWPGSFAPKGLRLTTLVKEFIRGLTRWRFLDFGDPDPPFTNGPCRLQKIQNRGQEHFAPKGPKLTNCYKQMYERVCAPELFGFWGSEPSAYNIDGLCRLQKNQNHGKAQFASKGPKAAICMKEFRREFAASPFTENAKSWLGVFRARRAQGDQFLLSWTPLPHFKFCENNR